MELQTLLTTKATAVFGTCAWNALNRTEIDANKLAAYTVLLYSLEKARIRAVVFLYVYGLIATTLYATFPVNH
jgi:hypothetical protein